MPLTLRLTVLLAGLWLPACKPVPKPENNEAPATEEEWGEDPLFPVVPDPSGMAYFPEGKSRWYTRYLAAMEEPSVMNDLPEGSAFVFRFTLLPTFSDNLAVRVFDRGGKIFVRSIRQKKRI